MKMSKSKIELYIEKIEQDFVNNYEAETTKLLAKKEEEYLKKAEELKAKTLDKLEKETRETLATTKQALDFEEKSKGEALKSLMITEIYQEVSNKMKNLSGAELLEYVYRLIAKENLKGHHKILVKKSNFDKYFVALSKKDNADLLNAKFKDVNFTLEIYDDAVEDGFIVEDKDFDLYFDFNDLINKHKEEHAFEIYQKLFGDK